MKKINKKILITGAAGFIGFSLAKDLLRKGYKIYGIDNFDNYYSTSLKKKRIKILNLNKNFYFKKIDIRNKNLLFKFLKNKDLNFIFHFAAQPGVRYSLINPKKYFEVNVKGFVNLLETIKFKKIEKFFYASSSSVYGDSNKFPVDEKQYLSPKNPYGISKKINEDIAQIYSIKENIPFIGLRFFTIYGEWGRPDMFIIKFFIKSSLKKVFELNNAGKHYRDFTYIGDVLKIIKKLMKIKKTKDLNTIYNICTSKPIYMKKLAEDLKKKINFHNIININLHKADVLKTHGNNSKLLKSINKIKFTNIKKGIDHTFKWYNEYYKLFF